MTEQIGGPDRAHLDTVPQTPTPDWSRTSQGHGPRGGEGGGVPSHGDIPPQGSGPPGGEDADDLADGDAPSGTPTQRALRVLIEWVLIAICALGLALLMRTFLVHAYRIPSGSMEPTLLVGDRVVAYKLGYRLHDINRGDVVVFGNPNGAHEADDLIKRVIAVGGETLELNEGFVFIDGQLLDEPYLVSAGSTFPKTPIPGCVNTAESDRCEVPEGKLLVLGDNREASRDGRYFGPVDGDAVVGRAFMKYWPPSDLGGL